MIIYPKVSIIMATYNRAQFIVETLLSIQNQTFQEWECIIIDDGGTDTTEHIIQPILKSDERFQFYKRHHTYKKGLPGSRNYGLDLAKGEYIIFFDDDDIVHPQNLEISVATLTTNSLDFCHYMKSPFTKDYPIFKNEEVTIKESITKEAILDVVTQKIGLASCTVLWKASCFAENRFNEKLHYAEEWELYCKLIATDLKGVMISNVLYFNRKHSNSNTGEFYLGNPIRRESYADAIVLVVKNLKEKDLLTYSLKRYFIAFSLNFSEFNLFKRILNTFEFGTFEKWKWHFFYFILPLRLKLYKFKKALNN